MPTSKRLDRLKVENFQSLAKVDLELGPFTVLVGPSNSGKSAALRALKAVARNVNSPSAVRVGKSTFNAILDFDNCSVSIERGKSQSTYRLVLPDGSEETYTKAGRAVPEDIQKALALPVPDGPDLVFSSQIDPPFLLNDTGSAVAKVLGDLTNVSKLHRASKEANRRRLEQSKLQTIREADMQGCVKRFKEEFGDLADQKKFLDSLHDSLRQVEEKAILKDTLVRLLEDFSVADAAEGDLHERLDRLPRPADIEAQAEKAGTLLGEQATLRDILTFLSNAAAAEDKLAAAMAHAEKELEQAEKDHHDALVQAGQCPTCRQAVSA